MAAGSSDTQTAIDILKADNERLNAANAALTSERDKHKGDHELAAKERDALKAQVGNPDEQRVRADKAEQALRVMTHKQGFRAVAKEEGAREDAIDDLFTLSGYNPTKDEIDPKVFHELVGELKRTRGYAFADPAAAAQTTAAAAAQAAAQQQQRPIPGQGRGSSYDTSKAGVTLTRAQLADPKFMLNPKNKDIIRSAAKEGRIVD
jgi:hypothetical protein